MFKSISELVCARCRTKYRLEDDRLNCDCGGLLDVSHDLDAVRAMSAASAKDMFRKRRAEPSGPADRSGVWRFRELVMPFLGEDELVTRGEGNTRLYSFPRTNAWLGHGRVWFKHEGENPTGSFKDRGLTAAMSWAKKRGARYVACASTGNTSASVASYASLAGLPAVIVIPESSTALGKISQSLAYGALTVKVRGDFDAAMKLILASRERLGLTVLNSVNPFRLEGQKTIVWEILEELEWDPPDWIVVPGGNLGNTSAFGKALDEARRLGFISRMPRLAVVQAAGAAPFFRSYRRNWQPVTVRADTLATAIKIGDPVNFDKAVRALRWTDGVVTAVTDQEIMDAKAVVDSDGVGAEPASCASAAGLRRLIGEGLIKPSERVVAVLTGNFLKDPDAVIGYHSRRLAGIVPERANGPVVIDADPAALAKALETSVGRNKKTPSV